MLSARDLRVRIVGAGPAGTTLARLLQLKGFTDVKIYEREISSSSRTQGGSLDLHVNSGQAALKACGLFEEFKQLARYEDQGMKIVDKNGKVHYDEKQPLLGRFFGRPEIDRPQLRDILLRSLNEGTIVWNKSLLSARRAEGSQLRHILDFKDGTSEEVDVLIGADGAWSRVRSLLGNDLQPIFSGVKFVEVNITKPSSQTRAFVSSGLTFILGEGKGLIASQMSNYTKVYCATIVPSYQPGAERSSNKEELLKEYEGWCEESLRLIHEAEDELSERGIYALPIGATWESQAGVTLIGDSAHLMSPFAGEGVNLAMADALDLANSLDSISTHTVRDTEDLAPVLLKAIGGFEKKMLKRAKAAAQESSDNLKRVMGPQAAESFARLMNFTSPIVWAAVVTCLSAVALARYLK
ncbi:FAD/NAD(P)-binding domain-containing protein [Atractiella rhizophila]|nr:FAD/NAD(P)-binding domain-containing protein [Atractiella rhizophila]